MNATLISREDLASLVTELRAEGVTVIAPARGGDGTVDYATIERLEEAALDGALPRHSLKELFFPPTEPLFSWRQRQASVDIVEVPTTFAPRVVLGAKPCDAAALEIVDRVMGWDYRDELWFGRREATTIVSLACAGGDQSCFCSATGLGPESAKGADVLLAAAGDGFAAEAVTEKGRAFVATHPARFGGTPQGEPVGSTARVAGAADLSMPAIRAWLEAHFEHQLWDEIALRCHGCGACAAVCPTCHCFDIVDEPEGVAGGTRRRNWDTCQTGRFTVHASGHNPRADQRARFRQRLNHKFAIYPRKFGEVLCTGCGRCARACPGGMDLPEILGRISALAAEATATGAAV